MPLIMEFIQNYVPLNVELFELFHTVEIVILISAKNILFRNKIFFSVLNISQQ